MEDTWSVDPKDEDVHRFQEQGFLCVGRLTTEQELAWLKMAYDEIVKQKIGYTPHELGQRCVKPEYESLVTVLSPETVVPALNTTLFRHNTRKFLARMLGVEETCLLSGWRLFFKPAYSHETPWHQDAAYRFPPYRSASVWMPLDPATVESSCLYYLAGSHRGGIRSHHFHDDHLVADDVDATQAIICPLSVGEAVIHHCCTLHYAGPNTLNRPRRAIALVCQVTESG